MPGPVSPLDDAAFMDALLDLLIPASGGGPGAGSLGISAGVAADLRADPMLGPMVEAGVTALRDAALAQHEGGLAALDAAEAKALVAAQLSANPFLAVGLMRHLCPRYYQHPESLKGLGIEPRPPFPEGYAAVPTDAALMEKLLARRKTAD